MDGDDNIEAALPPRSSAPQRWNASVAESRFYWYDLLVNDPLVPDFRDPIGRYQRRMQFALDATMEKQLLFFVVARPRLRFDIKKGTSWGFFGLKLSVPLLVGTENRRESITLELEVPFEATFKKPLVTLHDKYITLDWGALTECYSAHDLLQRFPNDLKYESTVQYIGITRDPQSRLAKGRLPSVNRIVEENDGARDTFLLIKRMNVSVQTDAPDLMGEASARSHVEVMAASLIRYFEGEKPAHHGTIEQNNRRERLTQLVETYQLESLTVDLGFKEADTFHDLKSASAPLSRRHLVEFSYGAGGEIHSKRLADDARPLISLDE
ncbi:hypothetical protein [Pseudoduganella violaceinigra]|uniref:hypothetical protein n=1 Tax=Pseudoduganella violaceinigra TaxID=246602 RepID=UPI0004019454|nr:hypothetical protein [Pseudoduganella violaceinigra]